MPFTILTHKIKGFVLGLTNNPVFSSLNARLEFYFRLDLTPNDMSGWDGYVNDMMKDTGFFDAAVILGKDSLAVWASTEEFEVRHFVGLVSIFDNMA